MEKYYLHTISGYRSGSYILRNSPNFELSMNENVEIPSIDLYMDKLELSKNKRPQNSKYDKYRELIKDVYDNYFHLALKIMKGSKWEGAEYYLDQRTPTSPDLIMYTTDPKNKFCIHIDIWDSVDSLSVGLSKELGFTRRPSYRKKAKPISESIFVSVLKETVKFIEDDNSYHINISEYLKNIKMIIEGNQIEGESNKYENIEQLINQLELKKSDILNRLIGNDSDTESTRASLRGEKDGIEYSLKAIKKYFRLIN